MSQQVLARKWRPTTFEQLIGQEHVRKALTHALDSGRLHHAYLFTGTRGVGKTTIARILARCLNCEQGISATPCGECSNCRAISENRFVDLLEVDAASRTKVDDTRELLENVSYVPSQGRYKVYLIDEVHMLTTHSFNALLKTLEEPPEHVAFLLATTDPQKLLPTVLSRCLQFHLRDLSPNLVQSHLEHVLTEEQITYENDALWHLAKAGRGSVRDAMTLLDQAIAHGQGSVTSANVIEMLGTQGISEIPLLLADIAKGDAIEALKRIEQLARETPDWMALVSGIQSMFHQVAVTQINHDAINHLSPSEQKAVRELATQMSPEFLQLAYQFALTGYRDLPMTSDARSGFEMLILRMIAFRPARVGEYLSETEANCSIPHSESKSEPEPEANLSAVTDGLDTASIPPPDTSHDLWERGHHETTDPVVEEAVIDLGSESGHQTQDETSEHAITVDARVLADATRTSEEQSEDTANEVTDQPLGLSLSPDAWVYESRLLGLNGMTASLLAQTVLLSASANEIILATNLHTRSLINDMHQRRIAEAFASQVGQSVVLVVEVRDDLAETPEQYRLRLSQERLALAKKQFTEDPFVSALTEHFDATVRIDSIEPRDGGTHV